MPVSRRDMLRVSSSTLVAPVAASLFPKVSSAEAPTPATPSWTKSFSQDLVSYINEDLSLRHNEMREERLQMPDLMVTAGKIRLLARHLEQLNFDSTFKPIVSKMVEEAMPLTFPENSNSVVLHILSRHNQSITAADIPPLRPSREDISFAKVYLGKHGLSGHLHNIADSVHGLVLSHSSDMLSQRVPFGGMSVYHRNLERNLNHPVSFANDGQHAHLQYTCAAPPKKPVLCSDLAQWGNYGVSGVLTLLGVACMPTVLPLITAALPGIGYALDAACAVIAINPWAAVYAVTTIVSLIISGIQLAVCS